MSQPAGLPPLGARVVVRRRRDARERRDGGPSLTDVLGHLEGTGGGRLAVRTRSGESVEIPYEDVVAVKEIPERAVPRRAMRALEAAAALGWPGLETECLGGWLLRAGGGFTGRANSALPLGDPGLPVDEAITAVQRWYAQRGLPARFQLPLPLAADLDQRLASQGWVDPHGGVDVIVLAAEIGGLAGADDQPAVRVDAQPDAAWLAEYHYRGGPLPEVGVRVLQHAPDAELGFASVRAGEQVLGIARGALSSDPAGRRWLGVTAVEVPPHARRRGVGSRLMGGLAAWAAQCGATDAYLQVPGDNDAALAFYARLGFAEHHRYRYRVEPSRKGPRVS